MIPHKSGALKIKPWVLDLLVNIPTGQENIFGERMYQNKRIGIKSNELNFLVKELPKKNKPKNFSGAVGDYNIKLVTNPNDSIVCHKSSKLELIITGEGKLNEYTYPKLKSSKNITFYTPKIEDATHWEDKNYKSDLNIEYLVVPNKSGVQDITFEPFHFFNPKTKKYDSIKIPNKELIVINTGTNTTVQPTILTDSKPKPNQLKKVIPAKNGYILTETKLKPIKENWLAGTSLYYSIFGFTLLALIPIGIGFRKKEVFKQLGRNNKFHHTKETLQKIDRTLRNKDYDTALGECQTAYNYLFLEGFKLEKIKQSNAIILENLNENNLPNNLIDEYKVLKNSLSALKYSGGLHTEKKIDLIHKTTQNINQFIQCIK